MGPIETQISNLLGHIYCQCLVIQPPLIRYHISTKNKWGHISLLPLPLWHSLFCHMKKMVYLHGIHSISRLAWNCVSNFLQGDALNCNKVFVLYLSSNSLIYFCSNILLSMNMLLLMKAGRWSNLVIIQEKKIHSDYYW